MSFLEELRQRKVVRVATGYVVAAWIAIQGASIALPAFDAPPWVLRVFILLFVLGFPLALTLSWALDVTSEGITTSPRSQSDKIMGLLVLLLIAAGIGWYYWKPPQIAPVVTATTPATRPATAAPPPATAAAMQPTLAATGTHSPTPPLPVTNAQAPAPTVKPEAARHAHPPPPLAMARPVAQPAAPAGPPDGQGMRQPHRPGNTEGERAALSPQCREILARARDRVMDAGGPSRPVMRRERLATQAQLRNAGCLKELRQASPEAMPGRR